MPVLYLVKVDVENILPFSCKHWKQLNYHEDYHKQKWMLHIVESLSTVDYAVCRRHNFHRVEVLQTIQKPRKFYPSKITQWMVDFTAVFRKAWEPMHV